MTGWAHNAFGPNLPFEDGDLEARCRALGIAPLHRVLDLGGAANPFPRANVVCDVSFTSSTQRNGSPTVFRNGIRYVEAPAEALPFADGEFDFVHCTQVLEHVVDPERAAAELSRVATRGFVEVPSRVGELCNGNPTHRWIVDREGDTLVFHPRPFIEHPFRNHLYGPILRDPSFRAAVEHAFRNVFNHQVLFEGSLSVRTIRSAPPFPYEEPTIAARSHYSFARNVLESSGDAAYVFPDALEAERLAPGDERTRHLLAVVQTRLGKIDDALATLAPTRGERTTALRELIESLALGRPLSVTSLPLPARTLTNPAPVANAEARPRVSILIAGPAGPRLEEAAESALGQDYPEVEVLVGAVGRPGACERLEMGARLRVTQFAAGTPLGTVFNSIGAGARGQAIGFVVAGDRLVSHHVDRLIAQLRAGSADAAHGDRLLLTGEGVVGPDLDPEDPAMGGASISTILVRRAALERVGAFDAARDADAPLEFLGRLARKLAVEHVREVTVEGRGPLPHGIEALAIAGAGSGRLPGELARCLMAAFTREEGANRRIAELEQRLRDLGEVP